MLQTSIELTESSISALSNDYVVYNAWANKQLMDWLKTKSAQLMEVEENSHFSSIHLTLLYIWQTQQWCLSNLQHQKYEIDIAFDGTILTLMNRVLEQSEAFCTYVSSLTEDDLDEFYPFTIPYIGCFSRSGFEIIQDCMNYSTHYREQLITISQYCGFTDPPTTDYMFYLLMSHSI